MHSAIISTRGWNRPPAACCGPAAGGAEGPPEAKIVGIRALIYGQKTLRNACFGSVLVNRDSSDSYKLPWHLTLDQNQCTKHTVQAHKHEDFKVKILRQDNECRLAEAVLSRSIN